ncbi:ATP-grasp fold amidoligase family protein [Paenibacillus sp. CF384]|uniref:ATP-grasp fold amidoligase family protein n=1 Tax=Paenibacillus sp. CF384 TaxID=1884382 RepID=UPI000899D84B|nr:ATP-grasp fold amidoligase family protein [Paenibacillus sp. CF384]SDX65763.1 TupA-like ATPgrasp [Paenibacillus sp. CF384]
MRVKDIIKRSPILYTAVIKAREARKKISSFVPDELYIKMQYRKQMGKKIDLSNPETINEKIQWFKLHWHNPMMTKCADKYAVRSYVEEKIGSEVLNKLYGVYEKVEDIDLAALPDSFVIKVNHGSGQNIICKDKSKMDFNQAFSKIKGYLKSNHYFYGREWAYKDIKPLIIIEEYLDDNGRSPADFKILCFHGKPEIIQLDIDRFGEHRRNYYNVDWSQMDLRFIVANSSVEIPKPHNLDEMLCYATLLANGFPFVRIDFYNFAGKIYFGEMTFYPNNGIGTFYPVENNKMIGDKLVLPYLHEKQPNSLVKGSIKGR